MGLLDDYVAPAVHTPIEKREAMYIWLDGLRPTAKMRSKTKIVGMDDPPPIWGFDGSSTEQATGENSDCVLVPVFSCPDPILGKENLLVLCEVALPDGTPHPSNTRANLRDVVAKYAEHEPMFGLEQEYTFLDGNLPMGWPTQGEPAPQGGYYCGVGSDEAIGRKIVEAHLTACLKAGLMVAGTNPEVMPAQWEFQVGPLPALEMADQLWMSRWILYRLTEDFGVSATLHPKPMRGDWNGAGCHTNYSTARMRADDGYSTILTAIEKLKNKADLHIANYGDAIEDRLTGKHETCKWNEFRSGVSDRGASIRIPWHVHQNQKGYLEDRRPNANCDPYVVASLIVQTTCE